MASPDDLQKDTTDYSTLRRNLYYLIDTIGHLEINLRNEDVLTTMYEDLKHMADELKELERAQKECPYELV